MLRLAFFLSSLLFLHPQLANATHFRYGHLTWQKVSGNTVRFTLIDAFRRSGYGAPNIGDVITETVGNTSLIFGDGSFTPTLQYRVIAVDVAEDWIIGRAIDPSDATKTTIDHTYASANNGGIPWLAEINTNARTSVEQNNPDGFYRLLTYVETTSGNRSPVSSLPAIVNLKQSALSTFLVPAADPEAGWLLPVSGGEHVAGNDRPLAGSDGGEAGGARLRCPLRGNTAERPCGMTRRS